MKHRILAFLLISTYAQEKCKRGQYGVRVEMSEIKCKELEKEQG